ncbi:HD domain-containing protein [Clostridium sp. DL1XJH146]
MLYRIKQFFWAFNSKITQEDYEFVEKYLEYNELQLFNKLSTMDKKHSIRTAVEIEREPVDKNINKNMLIKAGLLHDIGKITYHLNIFQKSIIVIFHNITKGKLKKLVRINSINIYYNHPYIGYNILKQYYYDQSFLELIKYHHNNDIIENEELQILKKCDNNN